MAVFLGEWTCSSDPSSPDQLSLRFTQMQLAMVPLLR